MLRKQVHYYFQNDPRSHTPTLTHTNLAVFVKCLRLGSPRALFFRVGAADAAAVCWKKVRFFFWGAAQTQNEIDPPFGANAFLRKTIICKREREELIENIKNRGSGGLNLYTIRK